MSAGPASSRPSPIRVRVTAGCGTCRIRRKCPVPSHRGDCSTCITLRVECLRRYNERVPVEYRKLEVTNLLKDWLRSVSTRPRVEKLSLTEFVRARPPPANAHAEDLRLSSINASGSQPSASLDPVPFLDSISHLYGGTHSILQLPTLSAPEGRSPHDDVPDPAAAAIEQFYDPSVHADPAYFPYMPSSSSHSTSRTAPSALPELIPSVYGDSVADNHWYVRPLATNHAPATNGIGGEQQNVSMNTGMDIGVGDLSSKEMLRRAMTVTPTTAGSKRPETNMPRARMQAQAVPVLREINHRNGLIEQQTPYLSTLNSSHADQPQQQQNRPISSRNHYNTSTVPGAEGASSMAGPSFLSYQQQQRQPLNHTHRNLMPNNSGDYQSTTIGSGPGPTAGRSDGGNGNVVAPRDGVGRPAFIPPRIPLRMEASSLSQASGVLWEPDVLLAPLRLPKDAGSMSESVSDESDDSSEPEGSTYGDAEDPDTMQLDTQSPLGQILDLGGRSIGSFQEEEAAELGSKLHSYLMSSNCSADPIMYAAAVKQLQDLCSSSGELPSSFMLENVVFDRKDVVGKGGEASVYTGDLNGRKVVVREVVMSQTHQRSPAGKKIIKLIQREVITHSLLDHPNIIRFLGVCFEGADSNPMMVLPFIEKGALADLISDELVVIKGVEFVRIVVGIGRALVYLHSRNPKILHGDLHTGNVLIDAFGNAFLCDFGFSRIRHEITRTFTNIREGGRTRFLAPELLAGTEKFRTSTASDIYSLSMAFFSTWARTLPFCELFNEYKVQRHIRKGRRPKRPTTQIGLPAEMEQGFWQLIEDMWAHDPSSRPSTDDMQRRLEATFSFLLEEHERARIG